MPATQAPPRNDQRADNRNQGYQNNRQRGPQKADDAALRDRLNTVRPKLVQLAGENAALVEQIVAQALTQYAADEHLQRCTLDSWEQAVRRAAALPMLNPDPSLGMYRFEGRWNKDRGVTLCGLQFGYRGLLAMCRLAPEVANIYAQVWHDGDVFEVDGGTEPRIVHKLRFPKGEPRGAYSVCEIKGSSMRVFEVMEAEEIEKCRNASKQGRSGPWAEWWGEMAKKTVLKRHMKTLPVGTAAQQAAAADDEFETDGADGSPGYVPVPPPAPRPAPQAPPATDPTEYQEPIDPPPQDEADVPPARQNGRTRQAPPAPADAKALRARARELYAEVRKSGPDVVDKILQAIGLSRIQDLATAGVDVLVQFNQACEQAIGG